MKTSTAMLKIFGLSMLLFVSAALAATRVATITIGPKIPPASGIQGEHYIVIESTSDNRSFRQIADTTEGIESSTFDRPVATDLSDALVLNRAIGWTVRHYEKWASKHSRIVLPEEQDLADIHAYLRARPGPAPLSVLPPP